MSYFGVSLFSPKHPCNIGSVARLCYNYEAMFLNIIDGRFEPNATNITRTEREIPITEISSEQLFMNRAVGMRYVAVELCDQAIPVSRLQFPKCANMVFGPEDGSLPVHIIEQCDHVVKLPTRDCLNLAMAVHSTMMYRLFQKTSLRELSLKSQMFGYRNE